MLLVEVFVVTLKSQLVADQNTEEIICVFCGKGRGHDFSLFKKSRVRFHPLTTSIEDSGYQGISQYHSNSYTPKKKPKNRKLTDLEKEYNKALAKESLEDEDKDMQPLFEAILHHVPPPAGDVNKPLPCPRLCGI